MGASQVKVTAPLLAVATKLDGAVLRSMGLGVAMAVAVALGPRGYLPAYFDSVGYIVGEAGDSVSSAVLCICP